MSLPSLILASVALAIACVAIARGIVWALEQRSLGDREDRRRLMLLVSLLVFAWVAVVAFETTPH